MSNLDIVDKKIQIQGHGIKISPALKQRLNQEGYYPVALTWIADDITGPFSFTGYGDQATPFELRHADGGYRVFKDNKFFVDATFYKKPAFFNRLHTPKGLDMEAENTIFIDEGMSGAITPKGIVSDAETITTPCGGTQRVGDTITTPCGGTQRRDLSLDRNSEVYKFTKGRFPYVTVACYNGLVIWPAWGCLYTKNHTQCKFCCVPGDYNEHKLLHTDPDYWTNLGDAFAAAVDEIGDEIGQVSLTVDSGTLPGRDKGASTYIKVLDTLKERLGHLPDLLYRRAVIEPPLEFEWLDQLAAAGYTDVQMDADVYDEKERRYVMPNAKGFRKIDDYIKAFRRAKEIFPGEVATQLIVGIQSDENLLKGVEHFASEGVPTLVTPFLPFGHGRNWQATGEVDVPSPERMKRVYGRAAEILTKYNVNPPQFRGGVSSLAETMGRRLRRARALTNPIDLARERETTLLAA
ncbi:MAG: radical SAM protein [Verrucomicrobiales bacterium]|jgi:hypothetical protein|nr:radical SAM protein [Verrucomicrobiales bacterium]